MRRPAKTNSGKRMAGHLLQRLLKCASSFVGMTLAQVDRADGVPRIRPTLAGVQQRIGVRRELALEFLQRGIHGPTARQHESVHQM